MPGYKDYRKC